MAIFTINANSNYSAIKSSLANGDTIRIGTDGVRLTIDEAPLLTNITVDSPAIAGRLTVNGAYDMSTWNIIAGTVPLIDGTFPAGASLGSVTGGSGSSAFGITTNDGTVATATGGAGGNAAGISTNNGTVTTATGGSATNAFGIATNNGTVATATGGSISAAHGVNVNNGTVTTASGGISSNSHGVNTNNGTVTTANGSSIAVSAHGVSLNNVTVATANGGSVPSTMGVNSNNGTVTTANGGSVTGSHGLSNNSGTVVTANGGTVVSANGVATNFGVVFRAFDAGGFAVNISFCAIKIVDGPNYQSRIVASGTTVRPVLTVYSIGKLSPLATLDPGITVIEVNEGSGAAFQLVGGGGLVF